MSEHIKINGFWDRVNQAIDDSGKNKSQISKECGFQRGVLQGESDNRMLSVGSLAKFCSVTGVSADWILGLKREKTCQK